MASNRRFSEIRTKNTATLCRYSAEFLTVKPDGTQSNYQTLNAQIYPNKGTGGKVSLAFSACRT